ADSDTLKCMDSLGTVYHKRKSYEEAVAVFREALSTREKSEPGEWMTFVTMYRLGASLMHQKNFAEAETQMRKSFEGLKGLENTRPPQDSARLDECRSLLVELYTDMNKPDEARKWQK